MKIEIESLFLEHVPFIDALSNVPSRDQVS